MYGCGRTPRRTSPSPALRQMALGQQASATVVGEAEAMVLGGVNNVLVTNQIVGAGWPVWQVLPDSLGRCVRRRRHQCRGPMKPHSRHNLALTFL